jgi:geranylgeranyl pyrophosphate synthase
VDSLVSQVGIYFQIRDDFQNLNSDEVWLHRLASLSHQLTKNSPSTPTKKASART